VHGGIPADLARLRQLRPDALVVASVAGAGHYMTLEVPDQVNAMLDRFLQIVDQRSPSGDEEELAIVQGALARAAVPSEVVIAGL
jgi:hypothetical protein